MDNVKLLRRLDNLIRLGKITEVKGNQARVKTGNNITPFCLWLTQRAGGDATWWAPSVGEQVVLLSPGGDLAQAVILPALNQNAFPPPSTDPAVHVTRFKDGTRIELNTQAKTLNIQSAGELSIKVTGNCTIKADGMLNLSGQMVNLNP